MSFLNSGIFGLGGMDGFAPAVPPQLANIYDKKGMKKAQIKSLLTNAGIAMLAQGPSQLPINLGTSIGQGLQAGMKAADQTGQDYRDVAYQTFKINQDQETLARQQEQQDYERKRQGINDQWAQQEHAHQQQTWQEQQAQKKNWENYVSTLPPDQQNMARMFPQIYSQQFLEKQFNTSSAYEKPLVETLYDEKTGQPYKGQWNAKTQNWERIGGTKAPGSGITITNPDGSVTQIGGGNKMTEADHKAQLLASQIAGQEKDLMRGFDSLAETANATGIRAFMDENAQVTEDALKNVVANWLYLTSGATATEGEVMRQFSMVRPSFFDKPAAKVAKRARLKSMIDDMKIRGRISVEGNNPVDPTRPNPVPAPTQGGWQIEEVQ